MKIHMKNGKKNEKYQHWNIGQGQNRVFVPKTKISFEVKSLLLSISDFFAVFRVGDVDLFPSFVVSKGSDFLQNWLDVFIVQELLVICHIEKVEFEVRFYGRFLPGFGDIRPLLQWGLL